VVRVADVEFIHLYICREIDWATSSRLGQTPRARFGGTTDAAYMYVWARAGTKGLMSSI
jgi:hypothetical protein